MVGDQVGVWERVSSQVGDGLASPLAVVPELGALADGELLRLGQGEALGVIEVTRAAVAALEAVQALAVEAFTRREAEAAAAQRSAPGGRGGPSTVEETTATGLAPVFCLARQAMGSLLSDLRMLVNDLPETFALVRAGRLDLDRARIVADAAVDVSRPLRGAFDEALRRPGTRRWRVPLPDLSGPSLRRRVARLAVEIDPDSAEQAAAVATREREVRVREGLAPGVSRWSAVLPSGESLRMWAAIDDLASEYLAADPALTVDQARADALVGLVLQQATVVTTVDLTVPLISWPGEAEPEAGDLRGGVAGGGEVRGGEVCGGEVRDGVVRGGEGSRPDGVTAAIVRRRLMLLLGGGGADAVVGDDDLPDAVVPEAVVPEAVVPDAVVPDAVVSEGLVPDPVSPPGHEPGPSTSDHPPTHLLRPWWSGSVPFAVRHTRVGLLLSEVVAQWLADPDTRVRLHGCDPRTGALVVHDPTTYRPGKRLARMVRVRDGHCRFPGCSVEVRRCQIDHVVSFPEGPTTIDNLACLCVTHHRFKTHTAWSYELAPDGTCTWVSPLGRRYVTVPDSPHDLAA